MVKWFYCLLFVHIMSFFKEDDKIFCCEKGEQTEHLQQRHEERFLNAFLKVKAITLFLKRHI